MNEWLCECERTIASKQIIECMVDRCRINVWVNKCNTASIYSRRLVSRGQKWRLSRCHNQSKKLLSDTHAAN